MNNLWVWCSDTLPPMFKMSNHNITQGLLSIRNSTDASVQQLKDYIEEYEWGLITAIRFVTDNTIDDRMTITRKKNGKKKNSMAALND